MKAHTFAILKEAHNFKEVGRARIASRTKHAHKAFRRNVGSFGKARELDSCVDVVAQNCFGECDFAGEHGVEAFTENN